MGKSQESADPVQRGRARRIAGILLLVATLALVHTPLAQAAPIVVATTIVTANRDVALQLEVAATPKTRIQGLMQRQTLAPHDGMLFIFPTPHDYSFWMKNTVIPLDMLFVDPTGRIVHIEAEVPSHSLAQRSSGQLVNAVIELDAGRASREAIAVGDTVRYELPPALDIR